MSLLIYTQFSTGSLPSEAKSHWLMELTRTPELTKGPSTKTGSARRQSKPTLLRSVQTSERSKVEEEILFSRGDIEKSTRGTLW